MYWTKTDCSLFRNSLWWSLSVGTWIVDHYHWGLKSQQPCGLIWLIKSCGSQTLRSDHHFYKNQYIQPQQYGRNAQVYSLTGSELFPETCVVIHLPNHSKSYLDITKCHDITTVNPVFCNSLPSQLESLCYPMRAKQETGQALYNRSVGKPELTAWIFHLNNKNSLTDTKPIWLNQPIMSSGR